jgi:hypothetical protein
MVDGQLRAAARWPKNDYLRIESALPDRRSGFIYQPHDLPDTFSLDANTICDLVLLHDWSSSRIPVASVDTSSRQLKTLGPIGCQAKHYAIDHFEKQPRYWLEGHAAFADTPGDWFVDPSAGEIVIIGSTEQTASPVVVLPWLDQLLIASGDDQNPLRNLVLDGIVFTATRFPMSAGGLAGSQATNHERRVDDGSRDGGNVHWHVDCGKSLPFIQKHPGHPCVASSRQWPVALSRTMHDYVSVQPHYGSTLEEDVAVISDWMRMQPAATFIIHTGWAQSASRAEEYASEDPGGPMKHSPAYFNALMQRLREAHPGRQLRQTHAIDLLDRVAQDIESGKAPITSIEKLHRDAIHMTQDGGRYLMHNAMRKALGQPMSAAGFEKTDPLLKAYLDTVLATKTH